MSSVEDPSTQEPGDWAGDDLEQAYLKAMSALEASELSIPDPPDSEDSSLDAAAEVPDTIRPQSESSDIQTSEGNPSPVAASPISNDQPNQNQSAPIAAASANQSSPPAIPPSPRQIIEACLFVGGGALTSQRLASVLRGDFTSDFVDRQIDELNRLYAAESRPYEIRLGDGGYRLSLREEHERIRYKVYGLGPKEVRLSQDALEVLAIVAYQQPIKQARIEELGKTGCGAVLRQLVRRELISIERDSAKDVSYKTTPRFLSLFGIRDLDELPRHEQVTYK